MVALVTGAAGFIGSKLVDEHQEPIDAVALRREDLVLDERSAGKLDQRLGTRQCLTSQADRLATGNNHRLLNHWNASALELSRGDELISHARLSNILREDVHDRLMKVLDHTVILAGDMQVDLAQPRRAAAVEPGQGDRGNLMLARPLDGTHDIFRIAR